MLLPGICCHWKSNFEKVIPLLADTFRVLCVSYDGFDETEHTEFPTMPQEVEKIEHYIKEYCGGQLRAAYGCSLGGSFVGLLAARQNIHMDYGILGSSDLDQASPLAAKLQTDLLLPLIYPLIHDGQFKSRFLQKRLAKRAEEMGDYVKAFIYNLDFPNVIAVRNQLLPAGDREQNIPCNLNDTAWFDAIDATGGAVFFASGVFYYFLKEQVQALVQAMADVFSGSVLVFDAANEKAVKLMLKTWLKDAEIKDVGAYFAISAATRKISAWDPRLQVSSRGYMLGYHDLKDPSVSHFFRFLSRIGEGMMKMQIVKIQFGKQ